MQAGKQPHKKRSQQEVATKIAKQLSIEDEEEHKRIFKIVQDLGRTQTQALCKETLQIKAQEGSPSLDPHAPGETFFHLVQTKGKPEEHTWLRDEATATNIAEQLQETEEKPRAQIRRIVQTLGEEQAIQYVHETLRIEENGGMLQKDGSRRRTSGGIFFHLVKDAVPLPGRFKLFPQRDKQKAQEVPMTKRSGSLPPLVWSERQTATQEAALEKGLAITVKMTVIGRPGRIVERDGCIVTAVQATKLPALPKGLPVPPQPGACYMLYIASKQWNKIAETIKADAEDVLIAEGYPYLDTDTDANHIAVFVTTLTTRKLQQAKRQAPTPLTQEEK